MRFCPRRKSTRLSVFYALYYFFNNALALLKIHLPRAKLVAQHGKMTPDAWHFQP
jgi:hypothetical protein